MNLKILFKLKGNQERCICVKNTKKKSFRNTLKFVKLLIQNVNYGNKIKFGNIKEIIVNSLSESFFPKMP